MTWEAVLTAAQAVREILLSIALFIGGAWAVYRYWVLERREAQLELKRQESLIGLTFYFNIDIRHQLRMEGSAFDLIGDIHIENPGTKAAVLDLQQLLPVRISRLALNAAGQYTAQPEPLMLPITASEEIRDLSLEGKGNASLKFVARLDTPGLYAVEFWCTSPQSAGSWMGYTIIEVSAAAVATQTKGSKGQ